MQDSFSNLRSKVRKAIDDIAPGVTDSFVDDVNEEIDQALEHAAMSLSRTLPLELLEPSVIKQSTSTPSWSRGARTQDGSGYIVLPADFLRFVSIKMGNWEGTVSELMEPGSESEKHQRSKWSRGSTTKPKAMLDTDYINNEAKHILRYWPNIITDDQNDTLTMLVYVKVASKTGTNLICALKDEAEKNLIYLSCQIFLEGKKEHAAADKFAQLATI